MNPKNNSLRSVKGDKETEAPLVRYALIFETNLRGCRTRLANGASVVRTNRATGKISSTSSFSWREIESFLFARITECMIQYSNRIERAFHKLKTPASRLGRINLEIFQS